jgi:HAD superfamily hydrolase (TIGR01509 family)
MSSWVLFDWGDTLMYETGGPAERPMAEWPEVRALDGAAEVLAQLAARHGIAVATNATVSDHAAIRRALARAGLDGFVREIFCFRDLGLKKADPRFWEVVAARLGVARARMVMVGDDLENDVLAPRRAGIAAVWLNWKRVVAPAGVEVPTVERLDQLPDLIRVWLAS